MQSVQQTYVFNQTQGAVTETVNGNWLQAYCEYLGVTQPVNSSWLQALCIHFGITAPLYGSWTIALANYYGITAPQNGTWWYALSQDPGIPPVAPFIWDQDTNNWEAETRTWNIPVAPVANFTSDTITIIEGQSVQFTDTSTGIPTGWSWGFTGAVQEIYTIQNPLVTYNNAGTYSVSLDVSNSAGSDIKTVPNYMTVNVVPVAADFSADTVTPLEGDTVTFTDTSTGTPTQWSWTLPGGTPATSAAQNPAIVYSTAGDYTVTLQASKTGSTDTEVKVNYISVAPPITAVPITEFATGIYYQTITNPINRDAFATTQSAYKIETI